MTNKNIFDTLQTIQNEKFMSNMDVFDIDNAWKQGTVDIDSKEAKDAQKKQTEKEKLKEKGFGSIDEEPKIIQASIDQLERNRERYEKKVKFDYPQAITLFSEAVEKLKLNSQHLFLKCIKFFLANHSAIK